MIYDFDRRIDRRGTHSYKWDRMQAFFGRDDLLPLWVADMDFAAPPTVLTSLQQRLDHGVLGYTIRPLETTDLIRAWMLRRHHVDLSPEWFAYCPPGIIQGIHILIDLLTHPGDAIVVQTPGYHALRQVVTGQGRVLVENPLRCDEGQYSIDFADLEAKLDDRTKLLLLCSPQNPTGRVWQPSELERLAELCRERNVMVISDEIHCDLLRPGIRHTPYCSVPGAAHNSITAISVNKTFNLGGLQTSTLIIPDAHIRDRFNKALDTAQITLDNLFGTVAVKACYSGCDDWLEQLLEYLEGNRNYALGRFASELPEIGVTRPEGTYFLWLDLRTFETPGKTAMDFLIHQARLALSAGTEFGAGYAGFARLNLACPRSTLAEALDQLQQAVQIFSARQDRKTP